MVTINENNKTTLNKDAINEALNALMISDTLAYFQTPLYKSKKVKNGDFNYDHPSYYTIMSFPYIIWNIILIS